MGEPAFNLPEDDRPDIRPDLPGLRALEGGGEGDGVPRGELHSVKAADDESDNSSKAVSSGGLASSEAGLGLAAKQLGRGFTGGAISKVETVKNLFWSSKNRRRSTVGGGVIGGLVGIGFMLAGISSGPLQAVHLSQILMKNFHGSEETSAVRTQGLFRFARSGNVGETRVGKLGSLTFGKTTAQLNDIGITYERSPLTGSPKTVTFNKAKMAEKFPELKKMNNTEARSFIEKTFDLSPGDLRQFSDGMYNVNTRGFNISATRALTDKSMSLLGDGKITTAVKFRVFNKFNNTPSLLHPIERVKASAENTAGHALDAKKAEEDRAKAREPAPTEETVKAKANIKDSLSGYKGAAAGALLVTAGMCLVRSIADDVVTVNQAAIVTPAAIEATDKIAVGAQVQAGQDVSMPAVGAVVQNFTNNQGQTIWAAKGIQETATPGLAGGEDITPDYKQAFNSNTTADNIRSTIGGGDFGKVACSKPGLVIQFAAGIGMLIAAAPTGGATAAAYFGAKAGAGLIATAGVFYMLEQQLTNLFSTDAIAPKVMSGPIGGNLLAYGARAAGGIEARSSGGIALSNPESAMLEQQQQTQSVKDFQSRSVFARVFDVHDYRSLASRAIDTQSPDPGQNLKNMAIGLISVNKWLPTILSSILPRAHAASTPYDWGFPQYGIPSSIANDPKYEDPYDNADKVAAILDHDTTDNYKNRALECFGATLAKGGDGWNVVAEKEVNPSTGAYTGSSCSDTSDDSWKRIMLFVFDTRTMDAISCYHGDDDQACSDVGFGSPAATTPGSGGGGSTSGPVAEGTNSQLAQKILDYKKTGQYSCDNPGDCADLQKVVAGHTLSGSQGCTAQTLDTHVLQLMLYAIEVGKFKIGTYSLCGDHSHDGAHGHSGGYAVDISSVNGVGVNQNSTQAKTNTLALDKFLNALPATLTLSQQISYGYGNHFDADLAATQQYGSKLCTTSCVSIYTLGVESEHENHIHAGY